MVYGKTSYVSVPQDEVQNLLNWSMQCMATSGIDSETMQRLFTWKFDNTETVRKFIYCFATSSGYGDKNGHFVKEKMMKLVADHKRRNEYGDVIDECNKSNGSDKYDTMYKTAVCFYKNSPILLKL
ncbi:unnamed protein product [Euphydryas editha]|nr:unnamed protein product [Euphydryas editha]